MPRAVVVTLHRQQLAIFPPRCAFSGLPNEGATVAVVTRDGLRGRALLSGWYRSQVPCRRELRWRVHAQRAWRFCRTVVVGLGSLALAAYLIHPALNGAALGLTCLATTALCIIAVVIWEKTHPPAFNITVLGDAVDFEFLDPDYAREFAALNRASISIPAQAESTT